MLLPVIKKIHDRIGARKTIRFITSFISHVHYPYSALSLFYLSMQS